MPRVSGALYALNVGEVSRLALARVDLERMRLAAEEQTNLLPQVLGPAMMRPGTEYKTSTRSDLTGRLIPFVFSASVTAALELTNLRMRVLLDGLPVTYPAVTASVPAFSSWTDNDESGASSTIVGGALHFTGTGNNAGIRDVQVTVNETGVEHCVKIVVARGPLTCRIGSSSAADDLVSETTLREGEHFLSFTPAGNFHIRLLSRAEGLRVVSSVAISTGALEVATPWPAAAVFDVRFDQSGDVLFAACDGYKQRRIERRSQRSWSVVVYQVDDGPFRLPNTTPTTITPSDISGNVTLTASRAVFKAGHVGALFRMTHTGQTATGTLSGADQFTNAIRVSGRDGARTFTIDITGTFVGTITIERSFGTPGSWEVYQTYTTSGNKGGTNDGLDDQIVFYRAGFRSGEYTSGTASPSLFYSSGIQTGVCRITTVSNETTATAETLVLFGRATATTDWEEGAWSDVRGWPTSVTFHDGRLWWGARDQLYGSVSDAFESFDDTFEGDAGPIQRSVATGAFEGVQWMLSLQRLLVGTPSQEVSIRSSSFDEPLTPTAFTARTASRRGCARLPAVPIDSQGIFVQRDGQRVFELAFDVNSQDYGTSDLTRLHPEICAPGVVDIAVQRQPDTRVWFVLEDGTCAILTYERPDEVVAWTKVQTTSGDAIESVCVLPGAEEDEVYFIVRRTIASVTKRYVEKLAMQSEVVGGTLNKAMDCHTTYSGSSTTTITGLSHLNGRQVVVWGNGAPVVTQGAMVTVSGGSVTLPSAVTNAVVGLPYSGRFQSAKLAYGSALGTALNQAKRVDRVGLVMADVGWKGVRAGRSFSELRGLSATYRGKTLAATDVLASYDDIPDAFNGTWGPDERICVEVASPYPATLMAIVMQLTTNDAA